MRKFGEDLGGWCSHLRRGSFRVELWKLMRRVWDAFEV